MKEYFVHVTPGCDQSLINAEGLAKVDSPK